MMSACTKTDAPTKRRVEAGLQMRMARDIRVVAEELGVPEIHRGGFGGKGEEGNMRRESCAGLQGRWGILPKYERDMGREGGCGRSARLLPRINTCISYRDDQSRESVERPRGLARVDALKSGGRQVPYLYRTQIGGQGANNQPTAPRAAE